MSKEAGTVTVTAKYLSVDSQVEMKIEAQTFHPEVPLAQVRAMAGLTLNMQNYESARVEVSVELPTYVEEVDSAIEHAYNIATKVIAEKTKEINDNYKVLRGKTR